jgi:hypothetical protein
VCFLHEGTKTARHKNSFLCAILLNESAAQELVFFALLLIIICRSKLNNEGSVEGNEIKKKDSHELFFL